MKTSIKTLISTAICAIFLSAAAAPVFAVQQIKTSRRISVPSFKKIVVTGNVDLLLVQNSKSGVIVDEAADQAKLKVTQLGETLKLTSNQTERVQVTVYVNDIFRIEASESATVKTFNKLNLKYLQVFLKDNASANIYTTTESLYTVVSDKAKLNLSGNSGHHAVVMGKLAMLTIKDFSCLKSEMSYNNDVAMLKTF